MFSKINIIFAALFLVVGFSSFSQSNSGSLPTTTVISVNGSGTAASTEKKVNPAENKSSGSNVKEINKKKRKSVHVTKVKKDVNNTPKAGK
jgi:hypothetical protein